MPGELTLEGTRPRNAVCECCGYVMGGGVKITGGVLICPECAHINPLGFDTGRRDALRRRARIAGFVMACGAVMITTAIGLALYGPVGAAVGFVVTGIFVLLASGLRSRFRT